MSARLTVQETADFLRTLDGVLILTHVRPDGDTVGCAAALCRALRALGRTAYLLGNPEITETYTPYAEGLWAPRAGTLSRLASVSSKPMICTSSGTRMPCSCKNRINSSA